MADWSPLHAQVHQTLRSRCILQRGQSVVVAVSGGQDSLCLLKIMQDLQPRWQWRLGVVHCDHRWRSDSQGNAEFVREWAESQGLRVHLCTADQPLPSEAAARQWRYDRFLQVALDHCYSTVVTGHTASDRAETLLYNLMRGAGGDGLSALQWSRFLGGESVTIVRPLLGIDRQATGQFCQTFQLPIWEDSTNTDRRYQRNRIRLDLLPYLQQEFNPNVVSHLAQTAELLQAEGEYLETMAQQHRSQLQQENRLHRPSLKALHRSLQRRILRQFLQEKLPQSPTFEHIEKLLALIRAPQKTQTDPFPGGAIAQVREEWIVLM